MDMFINKTISKEEDLCYDHVVAYRKLETKEGNIVETSLNFSVSEEITIPVVKHCLEFDIIKDITQPNLNHFSYTFEIEMLKIKSCYSIASLIISNLDTYNTEESKLAKCFINIITPFGLLVINVTDEVENDEILKLAGLLDLIYVLHINDRAYSNELSWVMFKPHDEMTDKRKEFLNNYLTNTVTIIPKTND